MASDIGKRITDLLAIGADTSADNVEQARTAAVKAARLMKEHGFVAALAGTLPNTESQVAARKYPPSWTVLFQAANSVVKGDPNSMDPGAFLRAVNWSRDDLDRVVLRNRNIHDEKIRKLHDLCIFHQLPFPLSPESDHPMVRRLRQLIQEHRRKEAERMRAQQEVQTAYKAHIPLDPIFTQTGDPTFVQVTVVHPARKARGNSNGFTVGDAIDAAVDFFRKE